MPAEAGPRLSLQFSPRVLVRSRLIDAEGEVHEAGVKDRELRWQKGAIAVSILLVYTKLRAEEGAEEAPLLEGEQGSPARSLDNLLNKPGDWAEFMFGEVKGQPGIRHYVYRKKAVSGSNPHSALQWDAEALDPAQIEITRANEPVTTPEGLRELLRVLLEEFNPRRVEREWEQLFPAPMAAVPAATTPAPFPAEQPAGAELPSESPVAPVPAPSPRRLFPWIVAVMALAVAAFAWWRPAAEVEPAEETPTATSAPQVGQSTAVVSRFLELLNARDLTGAYALTSQAYQERIPVEGFTIAFGDQRFNFPRIAGNPYRNRGDRRVHEYRVSLYVETEARRIPALESLSRLPVTEARAYAERLETLVEQLTSLGVEPAFLRQLRKERLERADAARYIQLVCGLSDAQLATLYPETVPVTLDLTLFFEVIRLPDDTWRIAEVQDATERLVAF